MTTIATVHGVQVTEWDQLVPADGRIINPKLIPYTEYLRREKKLKEQRLIHVQNQEWIMLQQAYWKRCTCPICGDTVAIPSWELHQLKHKGDLRMIGLILETILKMFQYGEVETKEASAKAA